MTPLHERDLELHLRGRVKFGVGAIQALPGLVASRLVLVPAEREPLTRSPFTDITNHTTRCEGAAAQLRPQSHRNCRHPRSSCTEGSLSTAVTIRRSRRNQITPRPDGALQQPRHRSPRGDRVRLHGDPHVSNCQ